jgi:hypothetical protein
VAEQLALWATAPAVEVSAPPSTAGRHAYVEAVLRQALGPKVVVQLTDNRSTMISVRHRRGVRYVRLHRGFGAAPRGVLEAVAGYVAGRLTPRRAVLIDRFIDGILPPRRPRAPVEVAPDGDVHDLRAIRDAVNTAFFEGQIRADITWSRARRSRRRRSSIRLGSYCDELRLIRVHPALDQAFVPEFFVASVVHHEMLHEKYGLERAPDGRRIIHSEAFRAEERRHPDYFRARAWERRHIGRLLEF